MKNVGDLPWKTIYQQLDSQGHALIPGVLKEKECQELMRLYPDDRIFRNIVSMERYRFGKGEYKYFSYPLPPLIAQIRTDFYTPLTMIANQWMKVLEVNKEYPAVHGQFLEQCHGAKQARPTPLILKYEAGGYNTLHQDLYGEIYFPFQVVFVLTEPGRDHEGGELVFTDQLPRAQSRATVLAPRQGDAVIFTTNSRPVKGVRGNYRARVKHGISEVISGIRYAMGIIFHDAA